MGRCRGTQASPGPSLARGSRGVQTLCLQVELEVLDVGEADFVQGAGAAAAVLEVDLLERFGGDLLEAFVGRALLLGVEEPGCVDRGEGEGEVADAV